MNWNYNTKRLLDSQGTVMGKTNSVEQIDKIRAAEKQLNMSIRLFFENTCPLSVHTLCAASNGILEALYTKDRDKILTKQIQAGTKRLRFSIKEEMEILIKEEYHKDIYKLMGSVANYLKHADKDHDQKLEADFYKRNCAALFGACSNFGLVTGSYTSAMRTFLHFHIAESPHLLSDDAPEVFKTAIHEMHKIILRNGKEALMLASLEIVKRDQPELFPQSL